MAVIRESDMCFRKYTKERMWRKNEKIEKPYQQLKEIGGCILNIVDKNIDGGKAFDWGKTYR